MGLLLPHSRREGVEKPGVLGDGGWVGGERHPPKARGGPCQGDATCMGGGWVHDEGAASRATAAAVSLLLLFFLFLPTAAAFHPPPAPRSHLLASHYVERHLSTGSNGSHSMVSCAPRRAMPMPRHIVPRWAVPCRAGLCHTGPCRATACCASPGVMLVDL